MPEKLISELIELPEKVRKGDFVLKLSEGVTHPEKTLDQYVVTPQLVACFEDALSFIHGAVKEMSSKACYLHGSFGSGKSHFMAVLHLLLQHIPAVRNIPELAKVCGHHEWVEQKKFLLVPYHMIGSRNMETAILGGYVDHVMQLHPGAPLPGVYLADEIFKNARQHREALGDDKFFAQLNQNQSKPAGGGWGKLAKGWDAKRFEAALAAPPKNDDRTRLVGDLVQFVFPAFKGIAQGKDEAYVDLDLGLSIISAHTKSLGYDGLILFLDELILWLASRSGDLAFLQMEGQKLSKLVESRKSDRPVPIISFVARQRDLRELIGDKVPGADQLNFSDVLSYWEGRFHTITLEDRNLPVIAQKRVLRPKNDACKAELEDAFEKTAQVRQEIMEILLTREADRAMFKMVYPFSPALIQALVAVSSALQRERTALKLMLQMLVNRRDTLRLGDVIPLGDLWDVVAHGDEAFTDVMRVNFTNAKNLYQNKLVWLPSFFSTRTQGELAKLVIIDRLLLGNNLEQHSKHLSAQDRETARLLLKNQQSALSQRLMQAVEAAYAIRSEPMPGTLDPAWDMSESHFQSLFPTLVLQRPVGANLGEALEHLLDQALSHQFPKHPKFGQEIKFGKDLRQVLEVCQEAVRSPDGRVFVEDKPLRQKLKNICNPLELGQMSETHFVLDGKWKTHFNKMLTQSGQTNPQVGEVRRWTNLPDERGLPKEIQNLLILVYADQTNRSFRHVHHGGNYTPTLDDLPNELELQEQTLPDLKDWNEAVTRVADIFGHAISKLLNASNLATMAEKVGESVTEFKTDCEALPDKVQLVLKNLGVSEAEFSKCDRVRTAKAVKSLLGNCDGEEPTALVGAIAHAKIETNSTSMGRSLKSAKSILECLGRTRWDLFSAVAQLQDDRRTAAELLIQDVCTWLKTDEHALVGGLASKLSDAEGRAIKLLTPPKPIEPIPPIKPPSPVPGKRWVEVGTGKKDRLDSKDWQATAEELQEKLEENPAYRITVQWLLEEEQQ